MAKSLDLESLEELIVKNCPNLTPLYLVFIFSSKL
jgi:hypothetical protein